MESLCLQPSRRGSGVEQWSWPVSGGQPVAKIAVDLGISDSCLRRWMAVDDVDAGRREGLTTDERNELVELRRRTRVQVMDNEILWRASAYFAREDVLPK